MTRAELWTLLQGRATELREGCVREWQQARQNVQRLQEHTRRLQQLVHDYGQRQLALQSGSHQIHQTAELRHTVGKLLALQQRARLELDAARAHEEQCRMRMQRAEAEVIKARTLCERAQREELQEASRQEQRREDAAAVVRHWLKAQPEPGT